MREVVICEKVVRNFSEPLIIAEVGANFNGDMDILKEMVVQAKRAGVDVVKFQSWRKESLLVGSMYKDKPAEITVFGHERQGDLLDYLSLTQEQLRTVKEFCDSQGIMFSSTPFSFEDVDVLMEMSVPFIKIASMDINHICFLRYIAERQVPVILSTGMGTIEEIRSAVAIFEAAGNDPLILLHCVALYPPEDDEINLNNIDLLRKSFDYPIGYSDHSIGYSIPLAAVAKGASVIEKHYTLDKGMAGWDHAVSATADEFCFITEHSKRITKALGRVERFVGERELEKKKIFRRSIVAKHDLSPGDKIVFEDIDFKRPGTGISPSELDYVLGRRTSKDIGADELIRWEDLVC
jgi:N-acetylneuraminate synthase